MSNTRAEASIDQGMSLELVQLEVVAESLQERLFSQGLVQDREQRSKTVSKAFLGADATTVLMDLLKEQLSPAEITRTRALQVGREIQEKFGFFVHFKSTKSNQFLLEDTETDLYQFENNLPVQVHRAKKMFPSLWNRVALLEAQVPVKSRRGLVKVHTACFYAREAVDVLMDAKLARTRGEAVHIIRKLNDRVHCCRPVDQPASDGTKFRDGDQLYKFFKPEHRVPEPVRRKTRIQSVSLSPVRSKPSVSTTSTAMSISYRRVNSLDAPAIPTKTHDLQDRVQPQPLRRKNRKPSASLSPSGSKPSVFTTSTTQSISRRRVNSLDAGNGCNADSVSVDSVTKDKAYFKERAQGIRSRLDVYRDERASAAAAKSA